MADAKLPPEIEQAITDFVVGFESDFRALIAKRNPPALYPDYDTLRTQADEMAEALTDLLEAFDAGNVQMNSPEIGGHDDIPLHPWHEAWLHHARAALARYRGEGT